MPLTSFFSFLLTLTQFDGKIICSGSSDMTIKVWDAQKGELLHTLIGFTNYYFFFTKKKKKNGKNTYIKLNKTYSLLFPGHLNVTGLLHLKGNKLLSGNADGTMRLWNVRTGM